MLRFWDIYGVWIIAYVWLLVTYNTEPEVASTPWNAFLLLNLVISLAVGYRALLRRSSRGALWLPTIVRWGARLFLYAALWFVPIGMFTHGNTDSIWSISLSASFVCLLRMIGRDIARIRRHSRPATL